MICVRRTNNSLHVWSPFDGDNNNDSDNVSMKSIHSVCTVGPQQSVTGHNPTPCLSLKPCKVHKGQPGSCCCFGPWLDKASNPTDNAPFPPWCHKFVSLWGGSVRENTLLPCCKQCSELRAGWLTEMIVMKQLNKGCPSKILSSSWISLSFVWPCLKEKNNFLLPTCENKVKKKLARFF